MTIVLICLLVCSLLIHWYQYWGWSDRRRRAHREQERPQMRYRKPDLEMQTWDGGINWYATTRGSNGGIEIIGLAREVYPEWYAEEEAWHSVELMARGHRAITIGGKHGMSQDDRNLLHKLGVTAKRWTE